MALVAAVMAGTSADRRPTTDTGDRPHALRAADGDPRPRPSTTPEPLPSAEPTATPAADADAPPAAEPTPQPTLAPDAHPAGRRPPLPPMSRACRPCRREPPSSSSGAASPAGRTSTPPAGRPASCTPSPSSTSPRARPTTSRSRSASGPPTIPGISAVSDRAPAAVSVAAPTSPDGFLAVTAAGTRVAFRLPADRLADASPAEPVVAGPVADYAEITPGVGLRVIAGAEGATSFFVWRAAPAEPTLRYVVDAPGLALALTKEGTIEARDAAGTLVGIIPRPYAVDSTARRAGGLGTPDGPGQPGPRPRRPDGDRGGRRGMARDRDLPGLRRPHLLQRGQPVLRRRPHRVGLPDHGTSHDYVRPDSPYYHELWLGTDPSGTSGRATSTCAGTSARSPARRSTRPRSRSSPTTSTTTPRPRPPTWLRRVIERPRATTPGPRPSRPGTTRYAATSAGQRPGGLRGGQHLHLRRGRREDPRPGLGQRHLRQLRHPHRRARLRLGHGRLPEHLLEAPHRRRAHRSRLLQAQDDGHLARPERDRDRQARLHRRAAPSAGPMPARRARRSTRSS